MRFESNGEPDLTFGKTRAGRVVKGFATDGVARLPATFKPSSSVADRGAFYVLSGWELGRREAASVLVKVTHDGTIDRGDGS